MTETVSPEMVARFWAKVDKRGSDECWPWKAATDHGYGQFWFGKRMAKAHRVSYAIANSVVLSDPQVVIRHKCDNRVCVNPAHLEPGSSLDNVTDMVTRRRHWAHKLDTCQRGHPLDGIQGGGWRRCETCAQASRMKYERKQKEMARG